MIVTARALREQTRNAVCERIEMCEKRGGVSASLFLDTELNDALPRAKWLFFYGGKRKWKGLLSVFYPTEEQAEFTVALAEQDETVFPALVRAAMKECRKWGVEECYTVVNPAVGFRLPEDGEVRFSYSHSEYFLCRETAALAETCSAQETQKQERRSDETEGAEGALERSVQIRDMECIALQKSQSEDIPVRYCLLVKGEAAAECFLSPFDGGAGWYLYHLETKEDFRRQGLATRLICEVAKDITAQGAKVLRLQVSSKNVPAKRLYRKLGFRTEEQRDYYETKDSCSVS